MSDYSEVELISIEDDAADRGHERGYEEGLKRALSIVQKWRRATGEGYELDRVNIYEELRFDAIEAELKELLAS